MDPDAVSAILDHCQIERTDLVLEYGPGRGALTLPLADSADRVVAVELDRALAGRLTRTAERVSNLEVVQGDFLVHPLPDADFRVVANPPFHNSTKLLARLLDRPSQGPLRADLVVEYGVARKWSTMPPRTLRAAGWTPWWKFEIGPTIPPGAFRPRPRVEAAVLTIKRRRDPVLPERLAPEIRDLLRKGWDPGP